MFKQLIFSAVGLSLAVSALAKGKSEDDMTLAEYTGMCEQLIGQIPELDSRKGVVIPITVDGGKTPDKYTENMTCDYPSLLPNGTGKGECIPYTRVQLLRDDNVAQMVALFRMKEVREAPNLHQFDEIDLIIHSVTNGATCFFQAAPGKSPTLNGTKVPSPAAKDAGNFWQTPQQVAAAGCGSCHDNDPFYYSPYIAQVIDQVPADPLGKYSYDIGSFPFGQWPELKSVTTRGNTCTGCHRIGNTFTCGMGLKEATGQHVSKFADTWAIQYPQTHWMPPGNIWTKAQWDVTYQHSVEQLQNCCGNDNDPPYCIKTPIK